MEIYSNGVGELHPGNYYDQVGKCLTKPDLAIPSNTTEEKLDKINHDFRIIKSLKEAQTFLDISNYETLKLYNGVLPRTMFEECLRGLEVPVSGFMVKVRFEKDLRGIEGNVHDHQTHFLSNQYPSHIIKKVIYGDEMVVTFRAKGTSSSTSIKMDWAASLMDNMEKMLKMKPKTAYNRQDEGQTQHAPVPENLALVLGDECDYKPILIIGDTKTWHKKELEFKEEGLVCSIYSSFFFPVTPHSTGTILEYMADFETKCNIRNKSIPILWQLIPFPRNALTEVVPTQENLSQRNIVLHGTLFENLADSLEDLLLANKKLNSPHNRHSIVTEFVINLHDKIPELLSRLQENIANLDIRFKCDQEIDNLQECHDDYESLLDECSGDTLSSHVDEVMISFRSANMKVLTQTEWNQLRSKGWTMEDILSHDRQKKKEIDMIEDKVRRYRPANFDALVRGKQKVETDIHIMLLGVGGIGRSTLGNLLLGKKIFETGYTIKAITTEPQLKNAEMKFTGQRLWVLDTPPIPSHLCPWKDVEKWLEMCVDILGDRKIHAILLVCDCESSEIPAAMEGGLSKALRGLGREMFDNTMAVFTRTDNMERSLRNSKDPLTAEYMLHRNLQGQLRDLLEVQLKKRYILVDPMASSEQEREEYRKGIITMVNKIHQDQHPLNLSEMVEELKNSESAQEKCVQCPIL